MLPYMALAVTGRSPHNHRYGNLRTIVLSVARAARETNTNPASNTKS